MSERGRQVLTLKDLEYLSRNKKCVVVNRCWKRHKPAAFVLSMQGRVISGLIGLGMYEYIKKSDQKQD